MIDSSYDSQKGLERLKNAFLFYFIGCILTIIPFVDVIGVILSFIGFIFLILGWRSLGRSSLPHASQYKSTGKWFIYALIIGFVIGIAGTVVILYQMVRVIVSQPPSTFNGTTNLPPGLLTGYVSGLFAIVSIVYVLWIFAYYKMKNSMSNLGTDILQPRLARSGLLYWINSIIGFFSVFGLAYFSFSGLISASSFSSSSSSGFGSFYSMLFGGLAIFGVLSLVGIVIGIIAAYYGYDSIKNALSKGGVWGLGTPMPPPPPSNVQSTTCPNCGKSFSLLNAAFCPNCGAKLNAQQP